MTYNDPKEKVFHYVAHIEIKRVLMESSGLVVPKREEVTDIAKVVVKSSDLENLKNKVRAHIELVTD